MLKKGQKYFNNLAVFKQGLSIGLFVKFTKMRSGGNQNPKNPFSVCLMSAVKATVKRRCSYAVVVTLRMFTPYMSRTDE